MKKTNKQPPKPLQQWFDQLEITLKEDAKLAGLYDHPSLTGTARELFLSDVIRNVMPPIVHIGTGKIVGPKKETSKQIDIVVYDSRFPLLRSITGIEIYLLEGVIATIEVKSKLNKNTIREALDNCHSVLKMSPYVRSRSELNQIYQEKVKQGQKCEHVLSSIKRSGQPYTYIFFYSGSSNPDLMCKHVEDWFSNNDQPTFDKGPYPRLPSLIISGNTIGASKDGIYDPVLSEYENPDHADRTIMIFLTTEHQFGILLSHIIHVTTSRLGLKNEKHGFNFSIKHHLPLEEYFNELSRGRDTPYIILNK